MFKLIQDYSTLLTCSLGLPALSDTQIVTQIIFSFIPTVIATLLEPFWVLVGRYLALYQPYIKLRRGNASPASSLGLKYTNIPPVLIAPRALRHGHITLFLASMMVITANLLAVALGGIFDRSLQPLTYDIMVTYPSTTSINTEMQTEFNTKEGLMKTFAKDKEEHWLVINTNVVEGTELPPWVMHEFYFLPFEWESGNNASLRTSMTQGYSGSLTCQLLSGNTLQQVSKMSGRPGLHKNVTEPPVLHINVTVSMWDGSSVRCGNSQYMNFALLNPGTHPIAVEWVWSLEALDASDQKALRVCPSIILAGWGRGEAIQINRSDSIPPSATMQSNTTIICNQQIATGKFRLTVVGEGRVKRSKLIGELKYDDPRIFNRSTSVGNFTAQMAILLSAPPGRELDFGIMHDDHSSHSFPQFIGEHLINKTLSDPSTPSPSFEDAQQALSKFYQLFFTILLAQNSKSIFAPAGKVRRPEVSQLESLKPRISMDPVMSYIAVSILGFQLIAGTIIFASTPRRFLPRFPYNLASEICFFHASSALSDVAGTADMSSARRNQHLKRLGGTYGYGKFTGSDGESQVGIERMSMIRGDKEAVVATSASSAIPETMAMVRTTAAVTSAISSSPAEGEASVDQIGTQAVSAVEGGTSMRSVTDPVSGSALPVAVAAGEDDLYFVV